MEGYLAALDKYNNPQDYQTKDKSLLEKVKAFDIDHPYVKWIVVGVIIAIIIIVVIIVIIPSDNKNDNASETKKINETTMGTQNAWQPTSVTVARVKLDNSRPNMSETIKQCIMKEIQLKLSPADFHNLESPFDIPQDLLETAAVKEQQALQFLQSAEVASKNGDSQTSDSNIEKGMVATETSTAAFIMASIMAECAKNTSGNVVVMTNNNVGTNK